MTQQTRQIGIMKATGGGTLQIFGMYLVLVMRFGIGALLLAVPLGTPRRNSSAEAWQPG